ncbi:hypothetical protein P879_06349 [Paragonimus westermani]|uniref:AIMP2 thioredoxin-like domain-containing protein n=1 Tax=Paragonimus westermani TaxID=34504 RepID=A0A8T0D2C0_9TREM|nr:hypothetical protein P879_06349 [Paragonimus westermani]
MNVALFSDNIVTRCHSTSSFFISPFAIVHEIYRRRIHNRLKADRVVRIREVWNMYKLDRIVKPVESIVHTDGMYQVDRLWTSPHSQSKLMYDEETQSLVTRLEELDISVSHLLNLFQLSAKSQLGKSKRPTVLDTPQTDLKEKTLPSTLPAFSLTVQANPENPPIAALIYCHVLHTRGYNISLHSYVHSTVGRMPNSLRKYLTELPIVNTRQQPTHALRIVWTPNSLDCLTFVGIHSTILFGEVMLLQKFLNAVSPEDWSKHSNLIMIAAALQLSTGPTEALNKLAQTAYFLDLEREFPSLVDCFLYSIVRRKNLDKCLPGNLSQWFKSCSSNPCLVASNVYWNT